MTSRPRSRVTDHVQLEHRGVEPGPVRPGVSVVINTLDEEENIAECISSVRDLADEIVVCDMHSVDRTADIARENGARVVFHERAGFVEPARRFAIEAAECKWVLVLDADERMTPPLAARLREIASGNEWDVVAFWSLYWYFGGWVRHGGFFHDQWRRFFQRDVYLKTYSNTEEQIHHNFESLRRARVLTLTRDCHIVHYAYPTVEKYVVKTVGRYARIEAEQYLNRGVRFSLFRMLGEPAKEFGVRFILRQGYRDGLRGFVLTCLYCAFRFSVWANVWFLDHPDADSQGSEF